MPRDDAARVRDIVEAGAPIVKATTGRTEESFAANDVLVRAVLYDFAVIGEAAKGGSMNLRASRPAVP